MTESRYTVVCRNGCTVESDLSDDGLFNRPTAERRAGFHEGSLDHNCDVRRVETDGGLSEDADPPHYKRDLLLEAIDAEEPVTEVDVNDSGDVTRVHAIQEHDGTAYRAQITHRDRSDGPPSVSFGRSHWDSDVEIMSKWTSLATGRLSGPQKLPAWESLFTVFNSALGVYNREVREPEVRCDGGAVAPHSEQSGLPLRDSGVPCSNCGCEERRPNTNRCAACGRFAPDPRYAYSKLTDTWYRVTEWDDLGDGKIRAREKEAVDRNDVPQHWRDAIEERDSQ